MNSPTPQPSAAAPGQEKAPSPTTPETGVPPVPLTPEEQMALFEKELKETDWGHQPC